MVKMLLLFLITLSKNVLLNKMGVIEKKKGFELAKIIKLVKKNT